MGSRIKYMNFSSNHRKIYKKNVHQLCLYLDVYGILMYTWKCVWEIVGVWWSFHWLQKEEHNPHVLQRVKSKAQGAKNHLCALQVHGAGPPGKLIRHMENKEVIGDSWCLH